MRSGRRTRLVSPPLRAYQLSLLLVAARLLDIPCCGPQNLIRRSHRHSHNRRNVRHPRLPPYHNITHRHPPGPPTGACHRGRRCRRCRTRRRRSDPCAGRSCPVGQFFASYPRWTHRGRVGRDDHGGRDWYAWPDGRYGCDSAWDGSFDFGGEEGCGSVNWMVCFFITVVYSHDFAFSRLWQLRSAGTLAA